MIRWRLIAGLFTYRINYKAAQWLNLSSVTPLNYIHCYAALFIMEQLEKDIQKLCKCVLNIEPNTYDNPNGCYETTCPFCNAYDSRGGGKGSIWATMNELKHDIDCAYLIAKDLSTGF